MTDIAVARHRQISPDRLAKADTATLRAELARSLTITAQHLVYLAAVWRELENRGEDLSDLRSGLTSYLPLIAAGQLDAEAVIRFAGQAMLLRAVAKLPIEEQQRLARGGTIPIVTLGDGDAWEPQQVEPGRLSVAQIRIAFGEGRVRTPREQLALVAPRPTRNRRDDRLVPVTVRLTQDEMAHLREIARSRGIRLPRLLREALNASGLLLPRTSED